MLVDIPVYIQTKEKDDFRNLSSVQFLPHDFAITEEHFKTLPDKSIVVFDDFTLRSSKQEFLNIVNYWLRHHKITLFVVIHNMYNNGLLHSILLSPHLILAYSNLGYYIIR